MDTILRERQTEIIKDCITKGLAAANDVGGDYAYRLGVIQGYMKSIKNVLDTVENKVIGTTGIIWIKADVITAFTNKFEREPTPNELDDILDILELNEVGEADAISAGWETIDEALDEFDKDRKSTGDKEND